MGEMRIIL